jgi:hypothetical protein
MELLIERCAGLDVHEASVTATVRVLTRRVVGCSRRGRFGRPRRDWCCWVTGWPALA